MSRPGLFKVNDPKDAISVVHVNKMLAAVSEWQMSLSNIF